MKDEKCANFAGLVSNTSDMIHIFQGAEPLQIVCKIGLQLPVSYLTQELFVNVVVNSINKVNQINGMDPIVCSSSINGHTEKNSCLGVEAAKIVYYTTHTTDSVQ